MNFLKDKLDNKEGFHILPRIKDNDYNYLYRAIEEQWIKNIECCNKEVSEKIREESIDIYNYHNISNDLPHSELWTKRNRIFSKQVSKDVLNLEFIQDLKNLIGNFQISDEENLGYENIYWRLVRPLPDVDTGGMHKDEWFWLINSQYKKPDYPFIRRKIWIPIYTDIGKNGLLVKPFSQLDDDIEWKSINKAGFEKPELISKVSESEITHLVAENGEIVVFHDKLLHGGSKNKSNKCRISLEFTAIINIEDTIK